MHSRAIGGDKERDDLLPANWRYNEPRPILLRHNISGDVPATDTWGEVMIRINDEQEAELRRLMADGFRNKTKLRLALAFIDGLKTQIKFTDTLKEF